MWGESDNRYKAETKFIVLNKNPAHHCGLYEQLKWFVSSVTCQCNQWNKSRAGRNPTFEISHVFPVAQQKSSRESGKPRTLIKGICIIAVVENYIQVRSSVAQALIIQRDKIHET